MTRIAELHIQVDDGSSCSVAVALQGPYNIEKCFMGEGGGNKQGIDINAKEDDREKILMNQSTMIIQQLPNRNDFSDGQEEEYF